MWAPASIYWGGDPAKIADELPVAAPTHVPAVPRIYEKIHGAVRGKVAEGLPHERLLFEWALRLRSTRAAAPCALAASPTCSPTSSTGWPTASCSRRSGGCSGSALEVALVGAAPIAPELLAFFDACGVLVLEGYGLDRELRRLDHQHGRRRSGSAPWAGRCRGPRWRSPTTTGRS